MREGYTHITVVLDRSSSMQACDKATVEGLNGFISAQQKEKGSATMTLVQFDDQYEVNYAFLDLQNVKPLVLGETYKPRGSTALLDAIGKTINETGARLAAMPESQRPLRVIFVIQTDGQENASREFNKYQTAEMIKHQQEKYNWDFVFLGANQDAIATAATYNIQGKSAMSYNTQNSVAAFASAANYTTSFRSAPDMASAKLCAFSEEEREDALEDNVTVTTTAGRNPPKETVKSS